MSDLKTKLIHELRKIDGVEDKPWPMAGGPELCYRGKSFGHFHNGNELDLRLTKKVIKRLGLSHPPDSVCHPKRSPNSPYFEVRFNSPGDFDNVIKLVSLAIAEL